MSTALCICLPTKNLSICKWNFYLKKKDYSCKKSLLLKKKINNCFIFIFGFLTLKFYLVFK